MLKDTMMAIASSRLRHDDVLIGSEFQESTPDFADKSLV